MTALLLLGPWTPLLFQGEEFGASTPFMFFTDTGDGRMREAIRKGRFEFLAQFPSLASDEAQKRLPVPYNPEVFADSKLDFSERQKNKHFYDMHIDLLQLRREDSRFREQKLGGLDGAVLGPKSFVLRYFSDGNTDDRLLVVNFGERQALAPSSGTVTGATARFGMGNTLVERICSLRRTRSGHHGNTRQLDIAGRSSRGPAAGA